MHRKSAEIKQNAPGLLKVHAANEEPVSCRSQTIYTEVSLRHYGEMWIQCRLSDI